MFNGYCHQHSFCGGAVCCCNGGVLVSLMPVWSGLGGLCVAWGVGVVMAAFSCCCAGVVVDYCGFCAPSLCVPWGVSILCCGFRIVCLVTFGCGILSLW